MNFANEFLLRKGPWKNEGASVRRRPHRSQCEPAMFLRRGREIPLYVPLLLRIRFDVFPEFAVVFRDEEFLNHLLWASGGIACLGSNRYCPSSIMIIALLLFKCGTLRQEHLGCDETTLANPFATVLGVRLYRAQRAMLVECLEFIKL